MTTFQEECSKVQPELRCVQSCEGKFTNWQENDCFFGVPVDEIYGRKPLNTIPKNAKSFHFYLGSNSEALIKAFVKSEYAHSVERLHIGDSCYQNGKGCEYENILTILSEGKYPNLKYLQLGVWQLFSNSHCAFGTLGDVTPLLAKLENLEELFLYGSFQLTSSLELKHLKLLNIESEDPVTGLNIGASAPDSISNLLSSFMPSLNEAFIDLENDRSKMPYLIPEVFLEGKKFPKLTKLEMTGKYLAGEKERLMLSELANRHGMKLFAEDMSIFD